MRYLKFGLFIATWLAAITGLFFGYAVAKNNNAIPTGRWDLYIMLFLELLAAGYIAAKFDAPAKSGGWQELTIRMVALAVLIGLVVCGFALGAILTIMRYGE